MTKIRDVGRMVRRDEWLPCERLLRRYYPDGSDAYQMEKAL